MGTTNASDPLQRLGAASRIAIADLSPEIPEPASNTVRGVVTITWPYSSVLGTFAFILAEPDYRLRRSKGQVRVNLVGASAKAVAESGLSSSDEVLVSLDGAEWEPEQAKKRQSLPGAGIDWQLKFSDKLLLQVTVAETREIRLVTVDGPPPLPAGPQRRAETPPPEVDYNEDPPTPRLETLTPPTKTHIARLKDGEYESPAFIKRARVSYGSLFEDGYDIFEDDGGVKGRGRKRSRFGRESGAWKYTSQSPSPEPGSPASPHQASSPPRPEMADEGCQTMEIDLPASFPTQASSDNEIVQPGPKSTSREEHPAHLRPGMVDHGVQGGLYDEWPNATSTSLPPFGTEAPRTELPNNGPGLHAFQPAGHFSAINNELHQVWDPRPMDIPPEGYLHTTEPPSTNNFTSAYGDDASAGLNVLEPRSRIRSPSRPNDAAIEHVENSFNNDLPADERNYSAQVPQQQTAYPPLDLESEEEADTGPPRPSLNYPPSYLDSGHPFSHENMDIEQGTFNTRAPVTANTGSSSWATVNNQTHSNSISRSDRVGVEGESPHTAVVIDESDSDDDPAPKFSTEDTVADDRADALEEYRDTEIEDEADAENSDEEEPEYDADEIGGDYDIMNYTAPDDDEDDSHDEDLRPHGLEPEFDDGESFDEEEDEEEDAEDVEYDSQYEMDEDEAPQQASRFVSQSTPQVIDLISSSEDEEDEATQPQTLSRTTPGSLSRSQPASSLGIASKQAPNQTAESESEEDEGSEVEDDRSDGGEGNEGEGEGEDEENGEGDERDDLASRDSFDESEAGSLEYEDMATRNPFGEYGETTGSPRDDAAAEPIDRTAQHNEARPESPLTDKPTVDRGESAKPAEMETIDIRDDNGDERMKNADTEKEEDNGNVPQSTAEGLEILSRAVENESNATTEAASSQMIQDTTVTNVLSPQNNEPSIGPTQGLVEQAEYQPQDAQDDEEMADVVDMVPTSPSAASNSHFKSIGDEKLKTATLSSPPLTHSFKSQLTDQGRTATVLEEVVTHAESQLLASQLPTPRDTQLSRDTMILDSAAVVSMEVSEPDEVSNAAKPAETAIHGILPITEPSISEKQPSASSRDTTPQLKGEYDEANAEQRLQTPPIKYSEQTRQPDESPVSPNSSFQTQVDADDVIQTSFTETIHKIEAVVDEVEVEDERESDDYPGIGANVPGVSLSFLSQMEIDEELQASIMEDSEFYDDPNERIVDEREIRGRTVDSEEVARARNGDDTHTEPEAQDLTSKAPSPELETRTPERQGIERVISAAIQVDSPEHTSQMDPSVQVALIHAARRRTKQHDPAKTTYREESNTPVTSSPTPAAEDPSVQLARASLGRSSQTEEDSNSMAAAKLKLVRYIRDELPDCTPLKVLRQHLHKKLDVIAVAMMQPPDPQRAKGGPREFMMSFTVTDYSVGPYGVVEVQLYRPHKETLPIVKAGDVVLLRNFTVVSLQLKGFGLRTNSESSWAIFDYDGQPAQIKGPPVEYGEKETTYVAHLRAWFNLLDEKARAKLEKANKKIIEIGRSKQG